MLPTPWPKWLLTDGDIFEHIYRRADSDFVKLRRLQGAYLRLLEEYKKEMGKCK